MSTTNIPKPTREEVKASLKGDAVWNHMSAANLLKMETNKAQSVDWDDEYFNTHFVAKALINKRPTPTEAGLYARSFLNWYVYNVTPSTIQDTMVGLISSVKYSENHYLISDHFFKETSTTTLSPPGGVEEIKGKEWKTSCQGSVAPQATGGASSTGLSRAGQSSTQSILTADSESWYTTLWKNLSAPPEDNKYPQTYLYSIYYLGFIAMQLLRVCVKDKNTVALHIMTYTTERYSKFFGIDLGIKDTLPPHDSMLNDFKINFDRFKPPSIKCLTMIVFSHISVEGDKKDHVQSIFRAVGLLSLSSVGLGCLGWLFRAHTETNVELEDLLKYVAVARHAEMVRSILTFCKTIGGNVNERSWQWCRLFTDGAFAELSTQKDITFAAIFMEVSTGASLDDPLWDIPQFQGRLTNVHKDYAYMWGQEILRDILMSTAEGAKTDETKRIVARMAKISKSKKTNTTNALDEDDSLHEIVSSEDET